MNIQESLKTKFNDKFNKLVDELLKETQKDFDIIWEDFIGEAKKKKEELKREGFALQERNKILKEEGGEIEITIANLNKDKTVLIDEVGDYDKQKSEIEKGKQENIDRTKQLDEIEEKLTEERLEVNNNREKMKAEMILLNDKQNSLKRAFSHLEK